MLVRIGIHYPRPGKETFILDAMRRFGEVQRQHKELIMVHALKDEKANALIGLAIWDSRESYLAAREDMSKALESANFDEWEDNPPLVFDCEPVVL